MTIDMGGSLNDLESRLALIEQRAVKPTQNPPGVYLDNDTGLTVLNDPLDWTVGGWESYTTVSPIITDEGDPNYPGGELSSDYGMPEASILGSMCVLTGLVRRKTGATPNPLAAGTRYTLPMFGLPTDWRPVHNVLLPCLIGNTDPATAATVGTGWIEVRPEIGPTLRPSGRVYFVTGTVNLQPTTGWVALQGIFPCQTFSGVP